VLPLLAVGIVHYWLLPSGFVLVRFSLLRPFPYEISQLPAGAWQHVHLNNLFAQFVKLFIQFCNMFSMLHLVANYLKQPGVHLSSQSVAKLTSRNNTYRARGNKKCLSNQSMK
jgi:hypothetical protein